MQANRRRDTQPELALRSELFRLGLRYRVDARPIRTVRCTADLVFPRARVAVFVDGCFWHRCPRHGEQPVANADYWSEKIGSNVERDRMVDATLGAAGWTVVRVWEHEDMADAACRLAVILHQGGPNPLRLGETDGV